MFGPGVDEAIETYRRVRAGDEPEIKGILMLNVSTDRLISKFKVTSKDAIGYNADGTEIVRVALKEPTIIREYYDASRDVFRHNIN
jgi:nitrate reductase beta subunit